MIQVESVTIQPRLFQSALLCGSGWEMIVSRTSNNKPSAKSDSKTSWYQFHLQSISLLMIVFPLMGKGHQAKLIVLYIHNTAKKLM